MVAAATADRCNTSATSRVAQHHRRAEDGHYRQRLHSSFVSSIFRDSSCLPALSHGRSSSFLLPSSFFHLVFLPRMQYTTECALTDSAALHPSFSVPPYRLPFLPSCPPHHIPPTLSNPPGSSQRCTTHVLTERRTSDLRGSRCDPLRVRHPPDGGRLGVAPRAVLSPSRLSRRLSSRLETIRYASDPRIPSTSNAGSR